MVHDMKSKSIRRALVLLLSAACFLCAFPFFAAAEGEDGSLTAIPVAETSTDEQMKKELSEIPVYVDIYPVADVLMDGSGRFDFRLTEVCSGLKLTVEEKAGEDAEPVMKEIDSFDQLAPNQKITSATWQKLAQDAAALVKAGTLNHPSTISIGKLAEGETKVAPLNKGLYLLIARTDETGYWKEKETKGEDGTVTKTLLSFAHSDKTNYLYAPVLITLPYKEAVDGVVATNNPGDWIYQVTAVLKPEPESRMGDLQIEKILNGFVGPDEAVFVFQIEATLGTGDAKKVVYSDVKSIRFSADGTKVITIEKAIPVGAEVTVTEVYSGAIYELETAKDVKVTISAEEIVKASFKNKHDDTFTGGSGIVNHYVNDGNGWPDPTQLTDSTAENGGAGNEN